jgi:aminoglycoside phosphotransferase (APT) family kinase protein
VQRLWDDRERVFDWLQRLPQTFAHGDYHRRNLIIRRLPGGIERVVAVDWAWCGIAPVGGDLGMLLGMSANLGDIEPAALPGLERPVCDAYLAGLRDSGWNGDGALARLGYAAWLAVYAGVTAPGLTAFWTSHDRLSACESHFGPPEQAARRWAAICEFALDRGDEARDLAERHLP